MIERYNKIILYNKSIIRKSCRTKIIRIIELKSYSCILQIRLERRRGTAFSRSVAKSGGAGRRLDAPKGWRKVVRESIPVDPCSTRCDLFMRRRRRPLKRRHDGRVRARERTDSLYNRSLRNPDSARFPLPRSAIYSLSE